MRKKGYLIPGNSLNYYRWQMIQQKRINLLLILWQCIKCWGSEVCNSVTPCGNILEQDSTSIPCTIRSCILERYYEQCATTHAINQHLMSSWIYTCADKNAAGAVLVVVLPTCHGICILITALTKQVPLTRGEHSNECPHQICQLCEDKELLF